jgi:hypothetical protein
MARPFAAEALSQAECQVLDNLRFSSESDALPTWRRVRQHESSMIDTQDFPSAAFVRSLLVAVTIGCSAWSALLYSLGSVWVPRSIC